MKPNVLFLYDLPKGYSWKDGLWKALQILQNDREAFGFWDIRNLSEYKNLTQKPASIYNFVLGWGAFGSTVDKELQNEYWKDNKKGLCLAANFPVNETAKYYDIIFYETISTGQWLQSEGLKNTMHAFGVNTAIFKSLSLPKIFDVINVGAWSNWKRPWKLFEKKGLNIAIGYMQKENMQESLSLALSCLLHNWIISDAVEPETLALFYNMSKKCIIVNDFGGERAVLEARACHIPVEIASDNPKLKELLTSPLYDEVYYAEKLKEGIFSCLELQ